MINQSPSPSITDEQFKALPKNVQKELRSFAALKRMVSTLIPTKNPKPIMTDVALFGLAFLSYARNIELDEIRIDNLGIQAAEELFNRTNEFYRDYVDYYC